MQGLARACPVTPLLLLALAGCAGGGNTRIATYQPAPGVNEVLRGPIEAAPGYELVTGDLVTPPGGEIPPHYHHGEEFIYVLGGSVTASRAGYADVQLAPGDGLRVAPGIVHWGRAGPEGARVISSWVKPLDQPLRVPVER